MSYDIDFETSCKKCGHDRVHYRSCINFCNEGYHDEHDDDPINSPIPGIEYRICVECRGTGIERWCPKCGENLSGVEAEVSNV